jgi:hypothetical protein
MLHSPAERGVSDVNFQALLKLVGEGHAHVKLSAPYRMSARFPDYPDARPFHDALVAANPERLMWGTDWPHPSIAAAVMPDDGYLSTCSWTGRRTKPRGGKLSSTRRNGCSEPETILAHSRSRLRGGRLQRESRAKFTAPENCRPGPPLSPGRAEMLRRLLPQLLRGQGGAFGQ